MNFFTRFSISNTIDSSTPFSVALRRRIETRPELGAFAREATDLDNSLRVARPINNTPPELHTSIMSAVIARARPVRAWNAWMDFPRLALAGSVLLAAGVVWFALSGPASRPAASLADASEALDVRHRIDGKMLRVQVESLSDELNRLNDDFTNAAQTLLAALP